LTAKGEKKEEVEIQRNHASHYLKVLTLKCNRASGFYFRALQCIYFLMDTSIDPHIHLFPIKMQQQFISAHIQYTTKGQLVHHNRKHEQQSNSFKGNSSCKGHMLFCGDIL